MFLRVGLLRTPLATGSVVPLSESHAREGTIRHACLHHVVTGTGGRAAPGSQVGDVGLPADG